MRTEELTTGRFRAYPPGAIPLWALSSKRVLALIGKTFGFEQFQLVQSEGEKGPPGLMFGRGRAPAGDPTEGPTIETLRISYDHIDLLTRCHTGHPFSDTILIELGRVCAEAAPAHKDWLEDLRVEMLQTVWVGQLDLVPEDLIDSRARAVLFPTLKSSTNEYAERRVHAKGLVLRVAPPVLKAELLELGLQLSDDEFKLEPRAGRLAREKAWFSTSPLRSEEHLLLLDRIERAYRS